MSFAVAADAYDRFMGRYSNLLAVPFSDLVGPDPDWHVLDVGCGPGALLGELVRRVGAERVVGVDPSAQFITAAAARHPGTKVRSADAEQLPFEENSFDAALAQLVVHFMSDPVAGIKEMARVTRSGGVVAACVWDYGEGRSPLSPFWATARGLDPDAPGESDLAGTHRGQLASIFGRAGLPNVEESILSVAVQHRSFDDWWEPFELGVGPAGAYVARLGDAQRRELARACRERFGDGPFIVEATAWAARATVP